jgi:hypothetical protein
MTISGAGWRWRERVAAPSRIEEVKAHQPAGVGQAWGLEYDERHHALAPCPACGAGRRHPKRHDRRGAIGLTGNDQGWRCHECGAGGDALDLAAWLSIGCVPAKGAPGWREVLAACSRQGLCTPDPRDGTAPAHFRIGSCP